MNRRKGYKFNGFMDFIDRHAFKAAFLLTLFVVYVMSNYAESFVLVGGVPPG